MGATWKRLVAVPTSRILSGVRGVGKALQLCQRLARDKSPKRKSRHTSGPWALGLGFSCQPGRPPRPRRGRVRLGFGLRHGSCGVPPSQPACTQARVRVCTTLLCKVPPNNGWGCDTTATPPALRGVSRPVNGQFEHARRAVHQHSFGMNVHGDSACDLCLNGLRRVG